MNEELLRGCFKRLRKDAAAGIDKMTKDMYAVEADIKGFFDKVNQEWLLKFLAHRIEDKRVQRMVKRFLKAGVAEDGSVTVSDEGTPQAG